MKVRKKLSIHSALKQQNLRGELEISVPSQEKKLPFVPTSE